MRFREIAPLLFLVLLPSSPVHAQRRGTSALDRVQAVVRAHRSAVSRCYVQARRERRDTPNHIDMTFVIAPSGQVTTVTFPPTVSSMSLGFCLGRLIRTWQFSPPEGGSTLTVNYPFDF